MSLPGQDITKKEQVYKSYKNNLQSATIGISSFQEKLLYVLQSQCQVTRLKAGLQEKTRYKSRFPSQ